MLSACQREPENASEAQQPSASAMMSMTTTATPTTTPTATATATATPTATPTAMPTPTATPTPTPERALRRGSPEDRLIAVMIDNHTDAYPHAGMNTAVMVFEALVENGITRYMAVFAPGISPETDSIGPVRSARVYFVQWARGFEAVYAHAGGSPASLDLVLAVPEVYDMDAMRGYASSYFYRSTRKAAPHNLYTDSALLQEYVEEKDINQFDPDNVGFLFKTDTPAEQRPDSQRLTYFFVYEDDTAGWEYDPKTNGYLRFWRGQPHRDEQTGKQLWFKNVVLMEVSFWPIPGDEKARIEQQVTGEGRARIFTDGVEREVFWRKPSGGAPLRFYDAADQEVEFNAGPVWIVAVPSLDNLTVEE